MRPGRATVHGSGRGGTAPPGCTGRAAAGLPRRTTRTPPRTMSAGLLPAALATLLAAACAGANSDDILEISFGHVGAPGSLFAVTAEEFAARVNTRLEGRAEVVVYGSSQLGGDEVLLQKLRLGTVDLALPSSIMSSRIPEFGIFELPYIVNDRMHMARIQEAVVWPELAPLADAQGFRILAVWENGFRHVTNNLRQIRVPADLEGLKLRTPRGTWRVKLFQHFGANPVPMAFSEVLLALRTGNVDGQENPLAQIHASRLHEVQAYLSITGHVYTPAYVTASSEHWQELPEDIRTVIEEEARGLQEFVYDTATRMDRELLVALDDTDIQVNWVNKSAFQRESQLVYDEFAAEVPGGRELIDRVLGLLQS